MLILLRDDSNVRTDTDSNKKQKLKIMLEIKHKFQLVKYNSPRLLHP